MREQVRKRSRFIAGVGAIALLGLASCAIDDAQPGEDQTQPPPTGQVTGPLKAAPYKAGEIIVRFKSGVAKNRSASVHAKFGAQVLQEYRFPSNLQRVKIAQGKTTEQAIEDFKKDPDVLYAEPNFIYQLDRTPSDTRFAEMYGLNNTGQLGGVVDSDINAPEAWDITVGSDQVVIGLTDTGFDYNHPDLAPNIFNNPGEIPGNGVDDDGNGYIDDVHGISAVNDTGDPIDLDIHGTHVTGTMAARGDNGSGVVGVNWNAKVVACGAFNPFGALDDLLQCMDYFIQLKTRTVNPVDIVATNNSWGGGPFSQALLDSIGAFRQAGILFVASAGNSSVNTDVSPQFPSAYDPDNIISVLATNRFDQRAFFSNFGVLTVDVGAPGEDILSTLPNNSFGLLSGTSMAAPHVTGLVGLLKAQNPSRTARQIKNLIMTGGVPSPATNGNVLSGRRIRADNSLNCVNRTLANRVLPSTTTVIVGAGTVVPLSFLSITCDSATTTPQVVTVVETGVTIPLIDDDGSGQFDASFTPIGIGTSTLRFPNGDLVSVSTVANYDPARIVEFEFPTIMGTALALNCDDCAVTITTPFPIRFAGASPGLSTLHVGSNGVLSFSQPITAFTNQPLPTTTAPTIVAPFWDDLILLNAGSSVRTETLGTAPNRQFVIEYRNVQHFPGVGQITFQIVFFEGSPNIRFNYADVSFESPGNDNGGSATVGIQVLAAVAQQFSFNMPVLTNSLSLLWTMGAPLASAGPDQVVLPLAAVTLDGSASTDTDGTIASFSWTQIAGTPVVLTGANTARPTFTAPFESGTLTFRLEVADNEGNLGSDTVNVIVNRPPVAVTNADFRIGTNLLGRLDGTASTDPDGVVAGFQWTQIHGDPVAIQGANTAIATFTSPATPQFLVFQLTVFDEHGFSGTAVIVVDVFLNLVPIADAGQNRIVRPGSTVNLNGGGSSDPDGTIASFAWTVTACFTTDGPCTVTLNGANTATPSFTAPSGFGVVRLSLTVTDNAGAVATDTITVGVFLQAPTAVIAAGTSCIAGGSTVTLDGSRSIDPDGTITSFAWTQISGPPVSLSGADSAVASFTAPAAGTVVFSLTVTDEDGLSSSTTVAIPVDAPPVARATISAPAVVAGGTVTLDGSTSSDGASFFWRQTSGTGAVIANANAATTTFVAPNPSGPFEILTFELIVTDACGQRSTATVSIVVVRAG